MKKILLDTSVIIDFLRRPDKNKSLFFRLVKQKFHLYITLITYAELYSGKSVWQSKLAADELELIFSGLTILPLNTIISKLAGNLKAKYNIDLVDCLIAASAIENNLEFATFNIREFKQIKGLKII